MIEKTLLDNVERKSPQINDVILQSNGLPIPSHIEINVTDICNRKCIFCPQAHGFDANNKFIELDLVSKISNDLSDIGFDGLINICGYGEPLLHKKIVDVVKNLQPHTVEIVTNADYLNSEVAKQLDAAGCNKIIASLYDGPEQIEKIKNIDSDVVTYRRRWFDEEEEYGLILTNRAGYLPTKKNIDINSPCNYLMYNMFIDWNGDILLCCQDWSRKYKFGNIKETHILDIWNSKEMNDFRKVLLHGRDINPCKGCDTGGQVYGCNHRSIYLDKISDK